MTFAAGTKVRASELNDASPIYGYMASTQSVTSSTTLLTSALFVTAVPNTVYALEGFIGYDAGPTGDFKMALTAPTGATGHWGLHGVVSGSTANGGSEGDLNGLRMTAFGTSNTLALGGSSNFGGAMIAVLRGYIATAGTGGPLTVNFAQNTSNATTTSLRDGSWLRLWKMA